LDVIVRRSLEEARRMCAPDVELWTLFDEPDHEPQFSGWEGVRLWFERLDELWAFIDVQEVEVSERDGGWVLLRVSARVRGRGSPHEFEPRVSAAIQVVDGQVAKFGLFPNEAGAVGMIDGK
jgi:ketosteroid isomerase-like protein